MGDFSAPSFSLGLDLDFVVDPDLSTVEESGGDDGGHEDDEEEKEEECHPPGPSSSGYESWREREGITDSAMGSPEEDSFPSHPPLKRLRRGPPPSREPEAPERPRAGPSTPVAPKEGFTVFNGSIQVVSSQEDRHVPDDYSLRQNQSACSSNFSQLERRVLPTSYSRTTRDAKNMSSSNTSIPINSEINNYKRVMRRFPASPARRIQFLESDLDDLHEDEHKDALEVDTCNENCFSSAWSVAKARQKTEASSIKLQAEGSLSKKNVNLATPAFDNFCQEYFKASKASNTEERMKERTSNSTLCASYGANEAEDPGEENSMPGASEHCWNLPDPQPPSYQYYYHTDVRIQKLVRQRLPNFVPLGDAKCMQDEHPNAATIDYMNQFDQAAVSFQACGAPKKGLELNNKRKPRTQKEAKNKNVADASGTWVNPRSRSVLQKSAGKKTVHASGQSTGYWYTEQDGKKVYVTRNGQELSGRIAYRHYRKERGVAFRKSRKKKTGKRKSRKR